MSVEIINYPQKRICPEFYEVIEFLKKYGAAGNNKNWHWARWEWLLGHMSLDEATLPKIGVFKENGEVLGLVTHDMRAEAYIICKPGCGFIKPQMAEYTGKSLSRNGILKIFIDENDNELISIAIKNGYSRTDSNERVLKLDCEERLSYDLIEGFKITDYYIDKNLNKYVAVIHKGFENKGEPAVLTEEEMPVRPHFNPKLAVFVAAPDGGYAAHCGTWYEPSTEICYVEPVVTIPEYRKRGLGKAAVYESINRCAAMGAKKAIVISDQRFYYNIGFINYANNFLWERR